MITTQQNSLQQKQEKMFLFMTFEPIRMKKTVIVGHTHLVFLLVSKIFNSNVYRDSTNL